MPSPGESLLGLDRALQQALSRAIARFGVPTTEAEAHELAGHLYPIVNKYRGEYYRHDVDQLGRSLADTGLEIAPAKQRAYTPSATYDAVTRAAGMGQRPNNVELSLVDEATREVVRRSVPAFAFPDEPKAVSEFQRRVQASLVRHARKAGRDGIADSVERGYVRDVESKRRYRGRVGYARVMTGRETCAFCAMLASRGPVYSKDTAERRRDGRRYHDGCDCIAVPVVEGHPWPGEAEYKRLEAQWKAVAGGLTGSEQWKAWQYARREDAPGVSMRLPQRDGKLLATAPYFGGEPLPKVSDLVKHSLWGWNSGEGTIDPEAPREGHAYNSVRRKGTFFPESWSDQDIADAITATIEQPDFIEARETRRVVYREVNGVMVMAEWDYVLSKIKPNTAHPIYGRGVAKFIPTSDRRVDWDSDKEKQMKKARRVRDDDS